MIRSSLRLLPAVVAALLSLAPLAPLAPLASLVACGAQVQSGQSPAADVPPAARNAVAGPSATASQSGPNPTGKAAGEACDESAACGEGAMCVYAPGCQQQGKCQKVDPHCGGLPVAAEFCGCDGKSAWHGAAACPMTKPFASFGPCSSP